MALAAHLSRWVAAAERGSAKFRDNGEACTAANRILVHDGVAEEFTRRFTAAVSKYTLALKRRP